MENQEYLLNLKQQFKKATGSNTNDINSPEFIKEFNDWLFKRRITGDQILTTLDKLEFEIDNPNCAELGKGRYDSIVFPYDTTIITPYYKSFNIPRFSSGKIITEEFDVYNCVPILTSKHNSISDIKIIKPEEISTYMVHNPYSHKDINRLIQLNTNPNISIIFSVFGNNCDKDKDTKIKMLNQLKDKILDVDAIIEEQITSNDKYWNILVVDSCIKQKKRTR